MPWLETAPMDQRTAFIADHRQGLYPVTELCARYGISRKTGYKWLTRFEEHGRSGLADRSRAPHHCPHRIAAELAELLCATRRKHPDWGAGKLLDYLDPRVKCLAAGVPRANLPIQFNTYQFFQIPGYVILIYEWDHMYRVIPLDGRPHVSPNIRLWMGDSRGHWEGNTLVVDVTNFTDKTWLAGIMQPPEGAPVKTYTNGSGVYHTEALHVVERFTPKDADTISYEATIEDPNVFTAPWTIAFDAFKRAPKDHMLYEYACFEGDFRHISLLTGIDMSKDVK